MPVAFIHKSRHVGNVKLNNSDTIKRGLTRCKACNSKRQATPALAAANAGFNLKQGADAIQAGQGDANGMVKNADGKLVEGNAADKAGGIGISLSIGASSSQSKQQSSADTAKGSNLNAGGNVSITATRTAGAPNDTGKDSDITVRGSTIEAGKATRLKADDQVSLLAAANTTQESNSSKNSSASAGMSAGTGGLGFIASASSGKGNGSANSSTYTNTQVSGNTVNIDSGGDTTIKGAVVKGDQVTANVGGNLKIESLQNRSTYQEKNSQAGGSVFVGAGASSPVSGNVNVGQTKINSDYTSVNEQSAIRAGDGGFNVNVQGKTALTGGQITSTQAAVDNNKNSFSSAGGVTTSDLNNSASYDAKSVSVGISAGSVPGQSASAGMSGVGLGKASGSASSVTTAGISGGAGNANARTGDSSTSLKPIFDAEKVKKEIEAQVTITQEFNKQAGKAIMDYTSNQRKVLQEQVKNASTPEDKAKAEQAIKDVNMQERALNILVSGLTGMAGATVTKEALSTAAEKMRDLMIEDSKIFKGVVDKDGNALFSNQSGGSAGVSGDGFKLAGTRADLDALCGAGGSRCEITYKADGTIDNSKPVKFLGDYEEFKKSPEGKEMLSAPFGGLQGGDRTWLFGMPYEKGSWVDKLLESFAGPHDLIGGKASGLYDSQGNATQGRSGATKTVQEVWSALALVPAAPLAASQFFSPEAWKAIGILLKGGL